MKDKILCMVLFLPLFMANIKAEQRVVIAEGFSATWCGYCPRSARAMHRLGLEVGDSMSAVVYHPSSSDPFYAAEAINRASYYGITGYPTEWFDGVIKCEGSYPTDDQQYTWYRGKFNIRKNISSPLSIVLSGEYNPETGEGTINANLTNTSGNAVSGKLHFVLTETSIPHSWQTEDTLYDVVRDMLPNANGESISIPAGDEIDKARDFTLSSSWDVDNCNIVVFAQASSKEIYQGAKLHIMNMVSIEERENTNCFVGTNSIRAYPNPFSRSIVISYQSSVISKNQKPITDYRLPITLSIYDLSGKLIRSFIIQNSEFRIQKVSWDGKDSKGMQVPSGLYFCKLATDAVSLTKKLIVVR